MIDILLEMTTITLMTPRGFTSIRLINIRSWVISLSLIYLRYLITLQSSMLWHILLPIRYLIFGLNLSLECSLSLKILSILIKHIGRLRMHFLCIRLLFLFLLDSKLKPIILSELTIWSLALALSIFKIISSLILLSNNKD